MHHKVRSSLICKSLSVDVIHLDDLLNAIKDELPSALIFTGLIEGTRDLLFATGSKHQLLNLQSNNIIGGHALFACSPQPKRGATCALEIMKPSSPKTRGPMQVWQPIMYGQHILLRAPCDCSCAAEGNNPSWPYFVRS